MASQKNQQREPIAIVGMECRFPCAGDLQSFWRLLKDGHDGIRELPEGRWPVEKFYDENPKAPGKSHSFSAGYIDDIDQFDATFFGISPREAIQMDPQQRFLLEVTQDALDNAGIPSDQLKGSNCAAFIGVMSNDYLMHQLEDDYCQIDVHTGGGAGHAMLANRLSYYFDWHGPSMAIDSLCSSSLVAVYQACQTLWSDTSDLAVAGGVNIILNPSTNIFYSKAGLLAKDGRCKTFSAEADGIGRGEGVGIVVLKRLSDALRDGNHIYASILGGAVNHGGRSNGVTAPNRWSQEQLMIRGIMDAGISSNDLGYIELHGTGTYIGDPIEANALGDALAKTGRKDPVMVGSVKTNIGHLEGAAGVAGLIKLALCLDKNTITPSLHYKNPSPVIDLKKLRLQVNTQTRPWPKNSEGTRIGAVSSFGLGGTNAHLVLQASEAMTTSKPKTVISWLDISGHSKNALKDMATKWLETLKQLSSETFHELCQASLRNCNHYAFRLQIFAQNKTVAISAINDFLNDRPNPHYWTDRTRPHRGKVRLHWLESFWCGPVASALMNLPKVVEAWKECQQLLRQKDLLLPSLNESLSLEHQELLQRVAYYGLMKQLQDLLVDVNYEIFIPEWAKPLEFLQQNKQLLLKFLVEQQPQGKSRAQSSPNASSLNLILGKTTEEDIGLAFWSNSDASGEHQLTQFFAHLSRQLPVNYAAWIPATSKSLPAYTWQHQRFWLDRHWQPHHPITGITQVAPSETAEHPLSSLSRTPEQVMHSARIAVGKALKMPAEEIDADIPLTSLGIDSLTAVEVKNCFEREWKITIPISKFLDGFSLRDLCEFVVTVPNEVQPEDLPNEASINIINPTAGDEFDKQVAAMSNEQVNEMLQWFKQQEIA